MPPFLATQLSARKPDLQRLHDRAGNLVLHRENVIERPVIGLRPQVRAVGGADQLRGNAQLVAGLAHTAFQHMGDVQLLRDLSDLDVLALESERGRARDHFQVGDLRQQVQQFLGDAVGHVLLIFFGGHVHKGQHRDRLIRDRGRHRRVRRRGRRRLHQSLLRVDALRQPESDRRQGMRERPR